MTDILIPCKSFMRGKSRLAETLSPEGRRRLCRAFLTHTLTEALATGSRVAVVTEDDGVARLSWRMGARVIADPGHGLNAALTFGNAALAGDAPLMILPADLPGLSAAHLVPVLRAEGLVIVPDRRSEGTNLLTLSPEARAGFRFAFGVGSYALHIDETVRRRLPLTIHRDPVLGLDIDTPADLALWPAAGPLHIQTRERPHETA